MNRLDELEKRIDELEAPDRMLSSTALKKRYGVSGMSLFRWQHDSKLGFPLPTIIRGHKYWSEKELARWEKKNVAKKSSMKARAPDGLRDDAA